MHGPPDSEQARIRKRRQRAREKAGLRFYRVTVSPAVLEALVLRNLDAGLSEPESDRAVLDRRKVAADLSDLLADWARLYQKARHA